MGYIIKGEDVLIEVKENAYGYFGKLKKTKQLLNKELNIVQIICVKFDLNSSQYVLDETISNELISYTQDNNLESNLIQNGIVNTIMPQNNHTTIILNGEKKEYHKNSDGDWNEYISSCNETIYDNNDTIKDILNGVLELLDRFKKLEARVEAIESQQGGS